MEVLSEDRIKKTTLQYLKSHYKYRLGADGKKELKLDQRGEGGIIADGHISFMLNEDTPYVATFEASSKKTAQEVLYRLDRSKLLWDSATVGSIVAMFMYIISYEEAWLLVKVQGLAYNLGIIAGVFLLTAVGYGLLFFASRRYRHIYAVEQFKRYFANDQWIAIGYDVFENATDPKYKELQRQCVSNGFGLLIVDLDDDPQLVVAPSRQDEFGDERQMIEFVNEKQSIGNRAFQSARTVWQRITQLFNKNKYNNILVQFQGVSYKQILLTLFCFLVIGLEVMRQVLDYDFRYPSSKEWTSEVAGIGKEKEPTDLPIESEIVIPFREREIGYLDLMPEKEHMAIDPHLSDIETFLASDSRLFTYYDCSRLYTFEHSKYLIKWKSFKEFTTAEHRVIGLMQKGIRCNIVWHGCFQGEVEGYIVFLDLLYNSRKIAIKNANKLQKQLAELGEDIEDMSILALRR